MTTRITRRKLREWGACYTNEQIAALVPRCGLSPMRVARMTEVPAEDRLWVLLRSQTLGGEDLRMLAAAWAERVMMQARVTDAACWDAVRVARLYAMGEATEEELVAARDAAWGAAALAAAAWEASWGASREVQIDDVVRILEAQS